MGIKKRIGKKIIDATGLFPAKKKVVQDTPSLGGMDLEFQKVKNFFDNLPDDLGDVKPPKPPAKLKKFKKKKPKSDEGDN